MKKAIIVGSAGQDGRLLEDLLRKKNYDLLGIHKDGAVDITQASAVEKAVKDFQPAEIYYLAAYHHSSQDKISDQAGLFEKSFQINTLAFINFLEAACRVCPGARLLYAASSKVFGEPPAGVQTELTPMNPGCAYGMSKATGVAACRLYRSSHKIFASAAILYNHESSLRGEQFLSRKIIKGAVAIKNGTQDRLELGDLGAEVDWGYAPDYVDAMFRILQLERAEDFIVAIGEKHSVKEFAEIAFRSLDLDWKKYVKENKGIIQRSARTMVGDPSKLKRLTGWRPTVNFEQMIHKLLESEGVPAHGQ